MGGIHSKVFTLWKTIWPFGKSHKFTTALARPASRLLEGVARGIVLPNFPFHLFELFSGSSQGLGQHFHCFGVAAETCKFQVPVCPHALERGIGIVLP